MSHNILKLNEQKPNKEGTITQTLSNLTDIDIAPSTGDVLGFGSGGTPSKVSNPIVFSNTASSYQSGAGWGGGGYYSVGDLIGWRLPSQTSTIDSSKASVESGGTWRYGITLEAGDYLVSMTVPIKPLGSSADYVDLRLKDRTNNTLIGPKVRVGAGKSSNFCIFPVFPTSSTLYGWEVVAIGGSPHWSSASQYTSFQFFIMEIL